jgi:NADH:ubiquinone oxidoreductase subunit 3 (subunit A)
MALLRLAGAARPAGSSRARDRQIRHSLVTGGWVPPTGQNSLWNSAQYSGPAITLIIVDISVYLLYLAIVFGKSP